ncbi:hypothetical protein RN001_008014 [Aquatica leii]|uniref:Uncharacterized protein n=1 Tax=Aquatica leii TaxID=1421715 RepID=A0AAN7SP36_9COLE|nr:hypothetical protein RN001_008014 [Aquatica leii]
MLQINPHLRNRLIDLSLTTSPYQTPIEPITNDHIDDDASIQSNNEPYQSSSSKYVPSSYSSSHEGDADDYANLRKELILANSTLCDEPSTKMLSNLPVSPLELACQLQEVPKSMKSPVFPLQICDKFQIPDNSSDSKIETTAYVNRAKKTISFLLTLEEEKKILAGDDGNETNKCSTSNIKASNVEERYNEVTVVNKKNFKETESMFNGKTISINEAEKKTLCSAINDSYPEVLVDITNMSKKNELSYVKEDQMESETTVFSPAINKYSIELNTTKNNVKENLRPFLSNSEVNIEEHTINKNSGTNRENTSPFTQVTCTQFDVEKKENTSYSKNNKITILSNIVLKEPITNDHIDDDASIQSNDEPYQSSGSEYVPSSYSSSHEGDEDDYANLRKELILANSTLCDEPSTKMLSKLPVSPLEFACQLQEVPKSMKSPVFPLQICDKFQIPDTSSDSEIETTAYVNRAKKTISGSRVYDKRHACYFCDKLIGKVTRHLELVHFKEIEVAKLLAMDKNSERRKEGFLCLLRAGDYYHNCQILAMKMGELILSRRPSSKGRSRGLSNYGPCPNCLGFFLLTTLWRHVKNSCPNKKNISDNTSRRDVRGESYALLSSWSETNTSVEFQKDILSTLKHDDVGIVCREDQLIIKLGALLFEKFSVQQHDFIRQTMRQLARLIIQVRSTSSLTNLEQILLPKNFDIIVKSVKQLCVSTINAEKFYNYEIPSLALKLGHSLRKCAQISRGVALRTGNLRRDREMQGFLEIMNLEWKNKVSSNALKTLRHRKFNCTQLLPITQDIITLNSYLDAFIQEMTEKIQLNVQENWPKLAAATLSRIILFNKRRSGEASRMSLNHYACRPNWNEQVTSELKNSLTPLEQTLANRLTIVEVPGKSIKNFKVPILITTDLKIAIDKLIETRTLANINPKNNYIFARGKLPDVDDSDGSETYKEVEGNEGYGSGSDGGEVLNQKEDICDTIETSSTKPDMRNTKKVAQRESKQKIKQGKTDINKKITIRKPWGATEKESVLQFFSKNIKAGTIPTKQEGEDCKRAFPEILQNRSWKDIKYQVLRKKLLNKLSQLDKEIKSLNALVSCNKNTQTDIKKKISIISSINSIIATDQMRTAIEDVDKKHISNLDSAEEFPISFKCNKCGAENVNEDNFDRKITEELNNAISWENTWAVCKKDWITKCYKRLNFTEDLPMEISNVAYVTSVKEISNEVSEINDSTFTGSDKFIFNKYNKIKYIHYKRRLKDNAINVYKDACVFEDDTGEQYSDSAGYKILGEYANDPDESTRYNNIYNVLTKIREYISKRNIEEFTFVFEKNDFTNRHLINNILEAVFRLNNSTIRVFWEASNYTAPKDDVIKNLSVSRLQVMVLTVFF